MSQHISTGSITSQPDCCLLTAAAYAERMNTTVDQLRAIGITARPCACQRKLGMSIPYCGGHFMELRRDVRMAAGTPTAIALLKELADAEEVGASAVVINCGTPLTSAHEPPIEELLISDSAVAELLARCGKQVLR